MLTGIRNQPEVGHRSRCAIDSVPIHWHGRAKQQGLACGARLSRRSEAAGVRSQSSAGRRNSKRDRRAGISLLIIEVISQKKKFEEEVYTRPLPLTSCQEDRLGLDYTVLCLRSLMAGRSFFSLAARSWKEYSERVFSGCPYGDTTTRVSSPVVGRRKCGSVRCSGDASIAPTSAQL